jgi:hypothetical protein
MTNDDLQAIVTSESESLAATEIVAEEIPATSEDILELVLEPSEDSAAEIADEESAEDEG